MKLCEVHRSDHLSTFSDTDAFEKPSEQLSHNVFPDSSGIANHLPENEDGECMHIKKLKYSVEETASLSKSFGCGICDELLATDKEFVEHSVSHQFSPPNDILSEL